jgi:hypothetical protein
MLITQATSNYPKLVLMTGTLPRLGHFIYPPLSSKTQTHAKRPLHMNRIRHGPKELFALKGI